MNFLSRAVGRLFSKPSPAASRAGAPGAVRSPYLDERAARHAAVDKLEAGDELRRLAGLSDPAGTAALSASSDLRRTAQARMARLIDLGGIDFPAFCALEQDRDALLSIASLCQGADRLSQALASIHDPMQMARLIVDSPSSRVRQFAAAAVDDPVELRKLLKQVRGKDKNVYKILKQKCDAQTAVDRRAAEAADEIEGLCASLERHSHRAYDPLYTATFELLDSRWHSLPTQPTADVELRSRQARDRCRDIIAGHTQQVTAEAARLAAMQAANEAREIEQRDAHAAAVAQADADLHSRREAAALREAEEETRAAGRAAEDQLVRQIGGLIRKANEALGEGNTQRAAGVRRTVETKLTIAPALPAYLVRHLQQLDDKLADLKQWKDYAVAPKRIELIEEMELLVGSTEEPKVLAERIKSLQAEWRTIGKGIVSDAPEEWQRFHVASQAAYQPCRDYFEGQARVRRENLEARRSVLQRLTAFEAAQASTDPNWRLVASVLREAPSEWRGYFPVERDANRALQIAFDESMGRLRGLLDAWHGRNVADKQSLIGRARHLLTGEDSRVADKQSLIGRARHLLTQEDSREAIEAVKLLQLRWRETGAAPRELDQSLWSEFRELCDAVYQRRQQAYTDYAAGLEANKVSAVKLCEEVEEASAASGPSLLESVAKVSEWRAAFDALGEMPRSEARGIQDRFERSVDRCEAALREQRVRDAEKSFAVLFAAGGYVQAYAWSVAIEADAAERDSLQKAARTFIDHVEQWPKGGLQAVDEALAEAGASSFADAEVCERRLRTLCIRCEIETGVPTPPEDEGLRREYQVRRLVRSMGEGNRTPDADWDSMMLEWVRVGAVSPGVLANLQERFMRCRVRQRGGSAT